MAILPTTVIDCVKDKVRNVTVLNSMVSWVGIVSTIERTNHRETGQEYHGFRETVRQANRFSKDKKTGENEGLKEGGGAGRRCRGKGLGSWGEPRRFGC